jgi:hypothetical protein
MASIFRNGEVRIDGEWFALLVKIDGDVFEAYVGGTQVAAGYYDHSADRVVFGQGPRLASQARAFIAAEVRQVCREEEEEPGTSPEEFRLQCHAGRCEL